MSWSVEDIMSTEREKIMEEEVIMSLVEAIGMQYIISLVGSVLEIKKTSRLWDKANQAHVHWDKFRIVPKEKIGAQNPTLY